MRCPDLRGRDLDVLRRIFQRFAAVREVTLFGSRARGEARRGSDIDLAISAPGVSAVEWSELAEAIEEAPILHEIEFLRVEDTSSSGIRRRLARDGIRIFARGASA